MTDVRIARAEIWDATCNIILEHCTGVSCLLTIHRPAFIELGRKGLPKCLQFSSSCHLDTVKWQLPSTTCSGSGHHPFRNSALQQINARLLLLEKLEDQVTNQKEEGTMSKPSMLNVLAGETKDAAIRAATKTAVKSVRNTAVAALEARAEQSALCGEVAAMLKSEFGVAVLSLAMGMAMHYAPEKFTGSPQMLTLAAHLRQDALNQITGEVLTAVAEPLLSAMAGPLALASEQIMRLESGASAALPSGES